MEERRKLERFDLLTPVQILVETGANRRVTYHLTTRDVSSAGAYLFSPQPIPEGTNVKMELYLSLDTLQKVVGERGKAKVRVKGKVVRSDPAGIAIRFDSNYRITSLGSNNSNDSTS